jgi:hypothetical protein
MKKRIALVVAMLGAIFAFAGNAMAAPPTICPNAALGSTSFADGFKITGNLTVPAGTDCRLGPGEVVGVANVAGNLYTFGKVHFDSNVVVSAGGSFAASNWGVTIDGNLNITDPAANSGNGFWGDYSQNTVKGAISYIITPTAAAAYPQYQWPYLYFGGPTTVGKSVTYSVGSLLDVRPFAQGNMTASGGISVS